jgi:regulating synaptic membrane exocytosis protein 2
LFLFSPFSIQTSLLNPHDTSDKRPKLERARSAAEKENHPLQRTSSQLRRQYSQQETSTQRRASASASDSGVDDHYLQRNHPTIGSSNVDGQYMNQTPQTYRNTSSSYYQGSSTGYQPENDPRYYQVKFTSSWKLLEILLMHLIACLG